MNKEIITSWGNSEFSDAKLGDKRLRDRLVRLADSFADTPESSINQACGGCAEVKAAYRFFKMTTLKSLKY